MFGYNIKIEEQDNNKILNVKINLQYIAAMCNQEGILINQDQIEKILDKYNSAWMLKEAIIFIKRNRLDK